MRTSSSSDRQERSAVLIDMSWPGADSSFRAMPPTRRRGGRGRGRAGPGPRPAGVCDFDSASLQIHVPMDLVLGYAHAALGVVPDIESRIGPLIMAVVMGIVAPAGGDAVGELLNFRLELSRSMAALREQPRERLGVVALLTLSFRPGRFVILMEDFAGHPFVECLGNDASLSLEPHTEPIAMTLNKDSGDSLGEGAPRVAGAGCGGGAFCDPAVPRLAVDCGDEPQ